MRRCGRRGPGPGAARGQVRRARGGSYVALSVPHHTLLTGQRLLGLLFDCLLTSPEERRGFVVLHSYRQRRAGESRGSRLLFLSRKSWRSHTLNSRETPPPGPGRMLRSRRSWLLPSEDVAAGRYSVPPGAAVPFDSPHDQRRRPAQAQERDDPYQHVQGR